MSYLGPLMSETSVLILSNLPSRLRAAPCMIIRSRALQPAQCSGSIAGVCNALHDTWWEFWARHV